MPWLFSRAMMDSANSHFSPAQEGESSAERSSDGAPCALWSSTPTPQACSWLGKTTDPLSLSRSGMTFARLPDSRGEAVLTSFLEDFPVRTSALPEKAPESTGSDPDCGERWRGSFARYSPGTRTWKTHQYSLLGGLVEYSETWPRWGTMRNGECSPRTMPPSRAFTEAVRSAERSQSRTTGIESGSSLVSERVPTPTVTGNHNRRGASPTSGDGLATYVRERVPTPTAHNAKEGGFPAEHTRNTPTLAAQAGGALNPAWVEWLMGWPVGWTSLAPCDMRGWPSDDWWAEEPQDLPRVAARVAHRRHRLRAIGNGQVPAVAALAWRILTRRLAQGESE